MKVPQEKPEDPRKMDTAELRVEIRRKSDVKPQTETEKTLHYPKTMEHAERWQNQSGGCKWKQNS